MTGNASPSSASAARGKAVAALVALAGAGLILLSAGRGWAKGEVTSPVRLAIEASGSSLTGVPTALGLAGLAGAIALFAVRRIGRYLVGLVMLAAGAGTVVAVVGATAHLDTKALARAATQTVGASSSQIGSVSTTFWPYLAIAGGILLAMAGLFTLVRGREWSGLSNKYEREGASTAPRAQAEPDGGPSSSRELWDALNRGSDPTL